MLCFPQLTIQSAHSEIIFWPRVYICFGLSATWCIGSMDTASFCMAVRFCVGQRQHHMVGLAHASLCFQRKANCMLSN